MLGAAKPKVEVRDTPLGGHYEVFCFAIVGIIVAVISAATKETEKTGRRTAGQAACAYA